MSVVANRLSRIISVPSGPFHPFKIDSPQDIDECLLQVRKNKRNTGKESPRKKKERKRNKSVHPLKAVKELEGKRRNGKNRESHASFFFNLFCIRFMIVPLIPIVLMDGNQNYFILVLVILVMNLICLVQNNKENNKESMAVFFG